MSELKIATKSIGGDRERFLLEVKQALDENPIQAVLVFQFRDHHIRYKPLNLEGYISQLIGLLEWCKLEMFRDACESRGDD